MNLFNVGRVCLKIAGRDAGRTCVIIEELDNSYVTIDGDVRRKKTNTKHLEPLAQSLDIKKGASHEDVKKAFEHLGWKTWEHQKKESAERLKKVRKVKEKKAEPKTKKALKENKASTETKASKNEDKKAGKTAKQ